MVIHEALVAPFVSFGFMRRALVASIALSLGCAPIGCLLVLRRMSLVGDALSHAILPGAAVAFWLVGLSVPAMSLGGLLAGLAVALGAGLVSRYTAVREDAGFAAFYLMALALGVLMVSLRGDAVDLMHLLFGSVLAVDDAALLQMATVTSITLLVLAWLLRPLVYETLDPGFVRSVGGPSAAMHMTLLGLLVANLVSAFVAMGTLMGVGLMMLPAIAARFWVAHLGSQLVVSALLGSLSAVLGLLLSYHAELPSGPAIVLVAGLLYALSLLAGWRDGVLVLWWRRSFHFRS